MLQLIQLQRNKLGFYTDTAVNALSHLKYIKLRLRHIGKLVALILLYELHQIRLIFDLAISF